MKYFRCKDTNGNERDLNLANVKFVFYHKDETAMVEIGKASFSLCVEDSHRLKMILGKEQIIYLANLFEREKKALP
jgi:hypothetical protein